jgi:type VI secretion system secreted protein Hcp
MAEEIREKAIRTFLKIDGIDGSSTYSQQVGSVEVTGWSHVFVQPSQIARSAATKASAGRAKHHDLIVHKQIDKTTRDLLKKCWEGGQVATMTISSYNADVKYLEILMKKVIITRYELLESPSTNIPMEQLTLNYSAVQYTYKPVDELGAIQGDLPVEHDLETGIIA